MSENMFLDQLRHHEMLCPHPNASFYVNHSNGEDRNIVCKDCPFVLSLHQILVEDFQWEYALNLADYYSQWTCQDDVVCSLNTYYLSLRVPEQKSYGHLCDIRNALELLRAIHYPFVQRDETGNSEGDEGSEVKEDNDRNLFRMLTDQHQMLIDRLTTCSNEDSDIGLQDPAVFSVVKMSLTMMRDAFSGADLYDIYFKILVPYVKQLKYSTDSIFKYIYDLSDFKKSKTKPLGSALSDELHRSSYFSRRLYQFCAALDAVHVMVLCYLFKDDLRVVANLVLDLGSKICKGGYYSFLPDEHVFKSLWSIRELLNRTITPIRNPKYFNFIQKFRYGGEVLQKCLSEEFFKTYWELKSYAYRYRIDMGDDKALDEFVFDRFFLRLLFERCAHDADYFAFVAALARYATGMKTESKTIREAMFDRETPPKVLIAECKQIFKFVNTGMKKVKVYDDIFTEAYIQRKDNKLDEYYEKLDFKRIVYWTPQICTMFFETHKVFQSEVIDMSDKLTKFNMFAKTDPKFREPFNSIEDEEEYPVNLDEVDGSLQTSQMTIDGKELQQEIT